MCPLKPARGGDTRRQVSVSRIAQFYKHTDFARIWALAAALEPIQQPPPERKPSAGGDDDGFVVMVETRPFERLSDDVVVCVLAWLGPRDLGRMAQVSKYFNRILRDKAFREWHRLKVRRVESRMAEVRAPQHTLADVLMCCTVQSGSGELGEGAGRLQDDRRGASVTRCS